MTNFVPHILGWENNKFGWGKYKISWNEKTNNLLVSTMTTILPTKQTKYKKA